MPEIRRLGVLPYSEALALQESLVPGALKGREVLLLLEHEPVYTIGRTRDHSSLKEPAHLPHPVVETNRGGQATFHGPGQLVGYPILHLGRRGRDIHRCLRFLEEVLIQACQEYGLPARRRKGLTGVWVADRKIASLGVGLRKWVTMHGFAINVCNSLEPFQAITPCGIQGVKMTSIVREAGKPVGIGEFQEVVVRSFQSLLEDPVAGLPSKAEPLED